MTVCIMYMHNNVGSMIVVRGVQYKVTTTVPRLAWVKNIKVSKDLSEASRFSRGLHFMLYIGGFELK